MTLLVIGSDERSEDYLYGLADSIRIVRIDFTDSQGHGPGHPTRLVG